MGAGPWREEAATSLLFSSGSHRKHANEEKQSARLFSCSGPIPDSLLKFQFLKALYRGDVKGGKVTVSPAHSVCLDQSSRFRLTEVHKYNWALRNPVFL